MNDKSYSYEVKGNPKPFARGEFLKLTKEGKITPSKKHTAKPSQTVTLRLFPRDGLQEDVLKTVKFGGGPNTRLVCVDIDRAEFFSIVDRIATNETLVRSLISDWRREVLNYLQGGTSPVRYGYSSYEAFLDACGSEDNKKSAAIISDLGEYFQAQIVSDHATESDFEGITSIKKTLVSKG